MSNFRIQISFLLLSIVFLISTASRGYFSSALNLDDEKILLMRDICIRNYHDAAHDRHKTVVQLAIKEEIRGTKFDKKYFYPQGIETPSCRGSAYLNEDLKMLIVSFHGSYWVEDWLTDAWAFKKPSRELLGEGVPGFIHKGFCDFVNQSYEPLMNVINTLLAGRELLGEIYFTGHSLGGAQAMLAGIKYAQQKKPKNNNLKIITFSSPRQVIGDKEFVSFASKLIHPYNNISFNEIGDIVVSSLPTAGWVVGHPYYPLGYNIEISFCGKRFDKYIYLPGCNLQDIYEHPGVKMVTGVSLAFVTGGPLFASATCIAIDTLTSSHELPKDNGLLAAFHRAQDSHHLDDQYGGNMSS